MITNKENQEIKALHAGYIAEVAAYKDALTATSLPLCNTADELATAYRTKLFVPLLAIDKGLKARWEMAKTNAAQIALIKATIDTDGHTDLSDVQAMQDALRAKYRHVVNNSAGLLRNTDFDQFAQLWEMDLYRAIDAQTIDLSDKQDIVAFYGRLTASFTELRDIFLAAGYLHTDARLSDVVEILERAFENQDWKNPLGVREMSVWHLSNALTHAGKRGIIPQA